jgi:DNA-directed RNA polymerase specialized sigma24 family protein
LIIRLFADIITVKRKDRRRRIRRPTKNCSAVFKTAEASELSQLVERHGDSVTLYINAIIGDAQDAEDLMIEAFSRICAKAPQSLRRRFSPLSL